MRAANSRPFRRHHQHVPNGRRFKADAIAVVFRLQIYAIISESGKSHASSIRLVPTTHKKGGAKDPHRPFPYRTAYSSSADSAMLW